MSEKITSQSFDEWVKRKKLVEIELECQRVLTEIKHGLDTIDSTELAKRIIEIVNKKEV